MFLYFCKPEHIVQAIRYKPFNPGSPAYLKIATCDNAEITKSQPPVICRLCEQNLESLDSSSSSKLNQNQCATLADQSTLFRSYGRTRSPFALSARRGWIALTMTGVSLILSPEPDEGSENGH